MQFITVAILGCFGMCPAVIGSYNISLQLKSVGNSLDFRMVVHNMTTIIEQNSDLFMFSLQGDILPPHC